MDEATALSGMSVEEVFSSGLRAELIEHYRQHAGVDFEKKCLVQMCCVVLFEESVEMPPQLRGLCAALCRPYSHRLRFWCVGGGLALLLLGRRPAVACWQALTWAHVSRSGKPGGRKECVHVKQPTDEKKLCRIG